MQRFLHIAVACVVTGAVVHFAGAQDVPEQRTIKRTAIKMGEENPRVIKIGETKAIKIGESRATGIGEQSTDKVKRIGQDVDIKAMHEAVFGPIGQNDWLTNAVPLAVPGASPTVAAARKPGDGSGPMAAANAQGVSRQAGPVVNPLPAPAVAVVTPPGPQQAGTNAPVASTSVRVPATGTAAGTEDVATAECGGPDCTCNRMDPTQ